MNEINQERFEAWLFSQPPERTFDYMDVNGGCAVCSFIRETTHHSEAHGGSDGGVFTNSGIIPLPEWMTRTKISDYGVLKVFEHESRNGFSRPITCAAMQRRYLELFPDSMRDLEMPALKRIDQHQRQ